MTRYYILFCILAVAVFSSCEHSAKKGKEKVSSNLALLYKQGLTHNDTITAKALVVSFMDAVHDGKYADAVANLYTLNPENPYLTPDLLDNEAIEETMDMMKKIKVNSYQIKSMEFISAVNNPTKCEIIAELPGTNAPVKLTWVLNPINYMGRWLLCFAVK